MKYNENCRSSSVLIIVYQSGHPVSGMLYLRTGVPAEDGVQAIHWGRNSFCNKVSLQSQAFTPLSPLQSAYPRGTITSFFLSTAPITEVWTPSRGPLLAVSSLFSCHQPVYFIFCFILHSTFFYKQRATPLLKNFLCSHFTLIPELLSKVWVIPHQGGPEPHLFFISKINKTNTHSLSVYKCTAYIGICFFFLFSPLLFIHLELAQRLSPLWSLHQLPPIPS